MGQRISLQEELINLKLTSKQMVNASKKCEKMTVKYKKDVKKAIEKGNAEGARIYAQNAIREKNQALNYLRMGSRIDAVAQRLETAIRTKDMSKAMTKVTKGMGSALKSMDVEKISKVMDDFEKQFEDMDVRAGYMETAMTNSTASATPEDQVDGLISQIADEHQLDVSFALDDAGRVGTSVPSAAPAEKDDLTSRMEALKR
jgi:charged multivesicular body protein 1